MRWSDVSVRRKGLAVMAIPVAALLFMTLLMGLAVADTRSRSDWVDHTLEVQRDLAAIRSLVVGGEAATRGYALTRDEALLDGLTQASSALPGELARLQQIVADNAEQRARADQLAALVDARLDQLETLRRDAVDNAATVAERVQEGADTSRQIDETASTMQTTEEALLTARRGEQDAADQRLWLTIGLLAAAGVLGGVIASGLFTSGVTRRLHTVTENAERLAAEEPTLPPPGGRDEIGQLGGSLQAASELLTHRRNAERDAREAAQVANRAKSDFLARMSHELRTPLNAMLGFTQILDLEPLEPRQHDDLARIESAGRHLLALINEVLDLSRIESGTMTLSTEVVIARDGVDHAINLMRPLASAVGIELIVKDECFIDRQTVRADRLRLQQVLINLISNAIKYNRPGGTVEVASRPDGPGRLLLTVTDTGAGITPDQQARLFQPFERLGAEKTTIEGTGIGLTLAKQLLELMDGALTLESQVDVGTTFIIDLPAAEPLGRAPTTMDERADEIPVERLEGESLVLQIEDNDANLLVVRRALELRPHITMLSAVDAATGLELARTRLPDLILLDMHLPDLDGDEVITALKRDPRLAAIPVLILSADASSSSKRRMLGLGADAYLSKPLDIRRLIANVDTLLDTGVPLQALPTFDEQLRPPT